MKKKTEKIAYIHKVNDFFIDAKNHGNNGSNWWYPNENTIAYNVKVYGGIGIESIREKLSKLQNEYYTDKDLYSRINDNQIDSANFLIEDIRMEFGLESGYAGRSGGWLEVNYINDLQDYLPYTFSEIEEASIKDINEVYKHAKKLEALEITVSEYIKKRHQTYCKYVKSIDYINDFVQEVESDTDIKAGYLELSEMYKQKAIQT